MDRILWIGFSNDLFYGRSYISAPAKLSIPVPLDEKFAVVPVRLAEEQSGGKRKVSYGDTRWNSERAAPSACVGRGLSAPQIGGLRAEVRFGDTVRGARTRPTARMRPGRSPQRRPPSGGRTGGPRRRRTPTALRACLPGPRSGS